MLLTENEKFISSQYEVTFRSEYLVQNFKTTTELYNESTSVKTEKMINNTDREIWEFARRNKYVIVTHDSDFNDLNALLGFPPKIIWVRTGNIRPQELTNIILQYESEIAKFISEDNYGCFEVFSIR